MLKKNKSLKYDNLLLTILNISLFCFFKLLTEIKQTCKSIVLLLCFKNKINYTVIFI